MNGETDKPVLTEVAKAAVASLGITAKFYALIHAGTPALGDIDMQALKKKAQAKVEDLEQLIGSGKLGEVDSQKLNAALTRLLSALHGGVLSHEALVSALSEAATALNTAVGTDKSPSLQQKMGMLWQKIDKYNQDIDDDFERMRKEGVVFDEKLWNKHKQLSEYLQLHPHEIEKQKELDAVDDQLLQQAEPQLVKHPNALPHFDDAKTKSKERHKDVANAVALTKALKQNVAEITDADWNTPQGAEVTINEITAPPMGKLTREQDKSHPFKKSGRNDGGLG